MSGEIISLEDFRKSAALVGQDTTDADEQAREAQAVLTKYFIPMLRDAQQRGISMQLMSMSLFTESVSALVANDWTPEEIAQWLQELITTGFFEALTDEGGEDAD